MSDAQRRVYADILSQAVTGELIGMANYAAMAELCPDAAELEDAVEHAYNERTRAVAFRRAAQDLGSGHRTSTRRTGAGFARRSCAMCTPAIFPPA